MAEARLQLRPAQPPDAAGIARVHVDAWRETYRGLIGQPVLDGLSVSRRQEMWQRALANPRPEVAIFVLESAAEGQPVGFSNAGPERGALPEFDGELYGIYLLARFHGQGYGRLLFLAAARHLAAAGFQRMMLWVLQNNPTRGFYEHMGGRLAGEQQVKIGGEMYPEVAYGWENLAVLNAEP